MASMDTARAIPQGQQQGPKPATYAVKGARIYIVFFTNTRPII